MTDHTTPDSNIEAKLSAAAKIMSSNIWLITLLVGLSQLAETVYTQSIFKIANEFGVSVNLIEHTLTIYLFGFALGILFWGKISDIIGRKITIMLGLCIFLIGCAGCYFSDNISMLMYSRLIQAFGGSVGSIMPQTMTRDVFSGSKLAEIYSIIGIALAIFPAIGPVLGHLVEGSFGWRAIFIMLGIWTVILMIMLAIFLPETLIVKYKERKSLFKIFNTLLHDKQTVKCALIMSCCNGILFSYFSESSFYIVKNLGMTPEIYSLSFLGISLAALSGGFFAKGLLKNSSPRNILYLGSKIIFISGLIFCIIAILHFYGYAPWLITNSVMAATAVGNEMVISFSMRLVFANCLALALEHQKHNIGAASSLIGFTYYILASLCNFGMGELHNGTVLPMPLYFFSLTSIVLLIAYRLNNIQHKTHKVDVIY